MPARMALWVGLVAITLGGPAAAGVSVTYVAPETFRDRELRNSVDRAAVLKDFDAFFAQLATRYLPQGQDLKIEVLDLDLAGDFEPWSGDYRDVRIMRDTTPPRMRLRYTLTAGAKVLRTDEVRLIDLNYLNDPRTRYDNARFAPDKRMLADWFQKTFAAPAAGPAPEGLRY